MRELWKVSSVGGFAFQKKKIGWGIYYLETDEMEFSLEFPKKLLLGNFQAYLLQSLLAKNLQDAGLISSLYKVLPVSWIEADLKKIEELTSFCLEGVPVKKNIKSGEFQNYYICLFSQILKESCGYSAQKVQMELKKKFDLQLKSDSFLELSSDLEVILDVFLIPVLIRQILVLLKENSEKSNGFSACGFASDLGCTFLETNGYGFWIAYFPLLDLIFFFQDLDLQELYWVLAQILADTKLLPSLPDDFESLQKSFSASDRVKVRLESE